MISADQPTIFGNAIKAAVSSVSDGMMKVSVYNDDETNARITENINEFLLQVDVPATEANYFIVEYDRSDFKRYARVGHPEVALQKHEIDGLATNVPGSALFLPLADCTGAVYYDSEHHAVMLSHLGRHSTEQKGAAAGVEYMTKQFGSDPTEVRVWLGPSPNGDIYPLWKRENMSLIDANYKDLLEAGIAPDHIEVSPVDTATDLNYYSHSEFLKGNRTEDGRFAIVAQLL